MSRPHTDVPDAQICCVPLYTRERSEVVGIYKEQTAPNITGLTALARSTWGRALATPTAPRPVLHVCRRASWQLRETPPGFRTVHMWVHRSLQLTCTGHLPCILGIQFRMIITTYRDHWELVKKECLMWRSCMCVQTGVNITGKTSLFEPQPSLEEPARLHPDFTSLDFATFL
jgi:hypothetical protein